MHWALVTTLAIFGAIVTIPLMWAHKFWSHSWLAPGDTEFAIIVTLWALGPPAWFAYENGCLIPDRWDEDRYKARMARFKRGQEVTKTFWFAVGTLIVATLLAN
jgi:hypothetical protein